MPKEATARPSLNQLKRAPKEVALYIKNNKLLLTFLTGILATVYYEQAPHSDGLVSLVDHMASGLLSYTGGGGLPVEQGLSEIISDSDSLYEFVPIAGRSLLWGAIAIGVKNWAGKKEERLREGREPLSWIENPLHVYVGSAAIASDLAQNRYRERHRFLTRDRIVSVHIGDTVPSRFGNEIDLHFKLSRPSELVGTFPGNTTKSFIEITGIDRTPEITFICFNQDNALFYGSGSNLQISPNSVSSIITAIPPQMLRGKKINVIMNETLYLGQTTSVEGELRDLESEFGFELKITKPEEIILQKLKDVVRDDQINNIVIVGQGDKPADKEMLARFKETLESSQEGLNVILVSNDKIEEAKLESLLAASQLCLCYGDSDSATSSLVTSLIRRKFPPDKIIAIVERITNKYDFDRLKIKDYWTVDEEIQKDLNKPSQK